MPEDVQTRTLGGRVWRIGTAEDVAWISSIPGRTIAAAIPPVFGDYATLTLPSELGPRDLADEGAPDRALLALLRAQTAAQRWWLGYLDTGASDIVFWDAPKVTLYTGWRYVFVLAGPDEASSWRPAVRPNWQGLPNWKSSELPDVMFPEDRSWLASMLWDDDWYCFGGPQCLIDALVTDHDLRDRARRIDVDHDAIPPGFTAH